MHDARQSACAEIEERIVRGDLSSGLRLDERTLAAFTQAENVLFVVNPEIATLKAVNALVEYLNEAGTVAAKSMFVLNNLFGREIVKTRDVESSSVRAVRYTSGCGL